MSLRKVITAGLGIDLISILFPLISYKIFNWVFILPPTTIWKWTPNISIQSFSIGELLWLFIVNTFLSIYFAYLYFLFLKNIPGKGLMKGFWYGILLYPIGVIIPMYSIYVLININLTAIFYFMLEGFVEFILYGLMVSLVDKSKS